jgi:MFS family permease
MSAIREAAMTTAVERPPVTETLPSGLTARHRTLLLLVGTATLFEGYDRFIVALALPYIGHDLGTGEGALATALGISRAGALLAIVLGRLADRHGRDGC